VLEIIEQLLRKSALFIAAGIRNKQKWQQDKRSKQQLTSFISFSFEVLEVKHLKYS